MVIDTPPTLGQILTAPLLASTYMLVPVAASPLAQDGLDDENLATQLVNQLLARPDDRFLDVDDPVRPAGASHQMLRALEDEVPAKVGEADKIVDSLLS